MKCFVLTLIVSLVLPTTINAEDNPFATKPRYWYAPFTENHFFKKKLTDSDFLNFSA